MKLFSKYIFVSLLLLVQTSIMAQTGNNPFEVFHTKKHLKDSSAEAQNKIKHPIKTIPKKEETVLTPTLEDSKVPSISVVESKPTIEQSSVSKTANQYKSNNPFEVYKNGNSPELISSEDTTKEVTIDDTKLDERDIKASDNIATADQEEEIAEEVDVEATNLIPIEETGEDKEQSNNPFQIIPPGTIAEDISIKTNNLPDSNNLLEEKSDALIEKITDPIKIGLKKQQGETSGFIFWVILFTTFLFAILINYKRSFILKSYRGILNENYLKLIKREENDGFSLFFMSLFFVFVFSFGAFVYLILSKSQNYDLGFLGYLYILLAILLIYSIRLIVLKTIGYVFSLETATNKFFFIILYYNVLLGISLLVINVLYAFGSETISLYSLYIGVGLIGSLLFIRYVRGLLLSIQQSFLFKIHFIFYLCGVEIAPVLLSLKVLENFAQ